MKNLLLLLVILSPFILSAQQPQDSSLFYMSSYIKNVASFSNQNPQEKVYLHFDNSYYHAGDTVWFKAYVVSTELLRVMDYSKILYIDLVSPEGETVKTVKLKIEKGQCHGDIVLRDTLFPGYYEIRAYTQAMLNFGAIVHHNPKPNLGIDESIGYRGLSLEEIEEKLRVEQLDESKKGPEIMSEEEKKEEKRDIFGEGAFVNKMFFLWDSLPYLDDFYAQRSMREHGSIFSRVFPVYNKLSKTGGYSRTMKTRPSPYPTEEEKNSNLTVNFYPEGGHLVTGHASVIAFEARNEEGKLVDIKGRLIESSGEELTSFKTTHSGKGMFYLQMDSIAWEDNKRGLKAEVEYEGKKYTFRLSPSLEQGYTMCVNNLRKDRVQIALQKSPNFDSKFVGLTIQSGGKVYYSQIIPTDTLRELHLSVSRTTLPTGVSQITLFDAKGSILAERLIFINHGEYGRNQFQVAGTKKAYEPLEAVYLDFLVKDSVSGKPIETTFSLSVTDNDYPYESYSAGNALSSLLLSSEIHGFVENPEYYFEGDDVKHRYHLDLLLRIQGWRRYSWQEMAGVKPFLKLYKLERSFILEGNVFNITRREPFPVSKVEVEADFFIDTLRMGGVNTTNNNGYFRFDIDEFMGEAILTVVAKGEKSKGKRPYQRIFDQKYLIPLHRVSPRIPKQYSFYEQNLLPNSKSFDDMVDSLHANSHVAREYVLDEAEVTKKRKISFLRESVPLFRLDVQEEIDKGIDLGINWKEEGRWFFPSLHRLKLRGKLKYDTTDKAEASGDADFYSLINYNYNSVDFWEGLIRTKFVTARLKDIEISANTNQRERYISNSFKDWNEKIFINMNSHPDTNYYFPEMPGRRTYYQGYSYVSDFYSPDYSQMTPPEKSDRRRTLYWNPNVKTDSTGRARVRFYNNSTCRYMKISAETVTSDGKPIVFQE